RRRDRTRCSSRSRRPVSAVGMPRCATARCDSPDERDSPWCPELMGPELSSPKARESAAFDSATTCTRTSSAIAKVASTRSLPPQTPRTWLVSRRASTCAMPERLPPPALPHPRAPAAPVLTALQGLDALELRPRHTVLIFGASGAVGTMAVQFAAQRGAHVIATASGVAAARLVRTLGAHRVIDARRAESIDQLRRFAQGGLDRLLALAGGAGLERCVDFVRPGGRVVHPNGIDPVPSKRRTFRGQAFDMV